MENNIYFVRFRGNILIVGKKGYGKTHFVQKLGLNNFFSKNVKTEWLSSISLSKSRQAEVQSCFKSKVEFHHAQDIDDLKELIETLKLRTKNLVENDNVSSSIYGENKIMDHLIVMDDVSGLPENCKEFSDFLTITRKY